MDFEETKYLYLLGLSTKVRDLIRTRDNITNIRDLQLACLRLDDHTNGKKSSADDTGALVASSNPRGGFKGSGRTRRGRGYSRRGQGNRQPDQLPAACYLCGDTRHRIKDCPKLKEASDAVRTKQP